MMLFDYCGVFGWISGKRDEISKFGQILGLRRGVGTSRHDVGILHSGIGPRRGVAERRLGQASGTPMCSKATLRRRPTLQRSSATPWCSTVHR